MDTVTVSPKFQVVIPLKVRKLLGMKPGQKMHVIAYDNQVVLIAGQAHSTGQRQSKRDRYRCAT